MGEGGERSGGIEESCSATGDHGGRAGGTFITAATDGNAPCTSAKPISPKWPACFEPLPQIQNAISYVEEMGVKPVAIHISPEVAKRIEMEGYTMFPKDDM